MKNISELKFKDEVDVLLGMFFVSPIVKNVELHRRKKLQMLNFAFQNMNRPGKRYFLFANITELSFFSSNHSTFNLITDPLTLHFGYALKINNL